REGWPNVVQEAMGCGTPVVATQVGAIPELIPSSRYGITVPPNDVAALARALAQSFQIKWDHAAISAWAQSRSWEEVATEVLEQMRQVIAEANGPAASSPQVKVTSS